MPANTLFSTLPPDIAQQQQQVLLQQALANQIQQKANQPPDMQGWNQMRVVPKLSPFAAGGQAGQQLMAALLQRKALQGQVDLNRRMYQAQQDSITRMSGGAPPSAPPDQGASPPPSPPPAGMPIDSGGGTTPLQRGPWAPTPENEALTQAIANQQAPPQTPQAPPQSSGTPSDALSSAFGPAQSAHNLGVSDEIIKAYLASRAPTEQQRNVTAAFGNGPDANAVLRHVVAPPTNVRPSSTLLDAFGRPTFTAPGGGIKTDWGPNGPIASPIPGYAGAAGQIAGAEAGGKAMNTPQSFETASGGTRYGYPGDVLGTAPSMRPPGPMPPPSSPLAAPPAASGGQPPASQAMFADIPKLALPTGLGAPDAFTKARLGHAAEKDGELSTKYGEQADMADQRVAFNSMALNSLGNAETGPLADRINKLRATAQEAGVPENLIPGWAKVAPSQELKKNLVRNAIVSLKPNFGARPAAAEFQILRQEANPSDSMVQLAIKRLLTVDNEKAAYEKQRAQDYGQYVQKGGDPMRFESWYASKQPMADRLLKADTQAAAPTQVTQAPPAALARLKANPALKADFKAKYGYLPQGYE